MNVSVEKLPKSRAKLRIEVPPDEVRPFLDSAARTLSKEHAPKGFRPGAAPLEVMRSVLGEGAIVEAALKELVPRTYVETLRARGDIEAIGQPEVEVERCAFDAPWVYTACVAVLPEVRLGNYRAVRGERQPVTVEAAEVERELEILRKMRASYLTVPRPARAGDRVDVDVRGNVERAPLESGGSERQSVLLGESPLIPGFEEQLVGMREGETKSFSIGFPEAHHRADLRGRQVEFTVHVRAIQQRVLPPLDDAFAKGLGNFQGLEDLKEKLGANIRAEKEHHEAERFHGALLEQVVAQSTFSEFPDALVERELDTMVAELAEGVAHMGLPFDVYLSQVRKTKDELRTGLREAALRRIRSGLALRALADAEGIAVSEEEVEAEVAEVLRQFRKPKDAEQELDPDALRAAAGGAVRNRKVLRRLAEIAVKNRG